MLVAMIVGNAVAQTFVGQMSGSWWEGARSGEGQLITFESAEQLITFDNIMLAISEYERSAILRDRACFGRWIPGAAEAPDGLQLNAVDASGKPLSVSKEVRSPDSQVRGRPVAIFASRRSVPSPRMLASCN